MRTANKRRWTGRALAVALVAGAAVGVPLGHVWSAGYVISSVPQGGKFYYVEKELKLLKDGALIYFPTYWQFGGVCAVLVRKSLKEIRSEGFSVDDVAQMSCWRPKMDVTF